MLYFCLLKLLHVNKKENIDIGALFDCYCGEGECPYLSISEF